MVDYRRLELPSPPTQALLEGLAGEGWRLVSVVPHEHRYVAFFERLAAIEPAAAAAHPGPEAYRAFRERMAGMLRAHPKSPDLQRLADGIGRLNEVFVQILREQLGEAELRRLAAAHPELAAALEDVPPGE